MNTNKLATVIETAKAKAADSPRWLRAIERAAAALMSGELCVTLLADSALVTSPNGSYIVTDRCHCKAAANGHKECRHRCAVRLTEMMESAPAPVPARITRSIEQDRTGVKIKVVRCRDNNGVEWAI